MGRRARSASLFVLVMTASVACGTSTPVTLGGPPDAPPLACTGDTFQAFTPPADPGARGLILTISGEALATGGYDFSPGTSRAADPAFVDGWAISFEHVLVSFDEVTLSDAPDGDPNDQSRTGAVALRVKGPWAYDLAKPSSRALTGKAGAPEKADPFSSLADLDPGKKYALGFETVPARSCAVAVNLDDDARAAWREMVARGYVVYYVGTASYRGDAACTTSGARDFSKLPREVHFRLGFASPSAYVNCQNPDLQGPADNAFEEAPRGVQVKPNAGSTAQLTFHTDHPFWDKLTHDAPLHFDPIAAAAVAGNGGVAEVTTDSLARLDYNGFRFPDGTPLPPRSCAADFTPIRSEQLRYDPSGVGPLLTYLDFATYSQSTQGHLNANGLCAVKRRYKSPR